jgi:hypothetical protein
MALSKTAAAASIAGNDLLAIATRADLDRRFARRSVSKVNSSIRKSDTWKPAGQCGPVDERMGAPCSDIPNVSQVVWRQLPDNRHKTDRVHWNLIQAPACPGLLGPRAKGSREMG